MELASFDRRLLLYIGCDEFVGACVGVLWNEPWFELLRRCIVRLLCVGLNSMDRAPLGDGIGCVDCWKTDACVCGFPPGASLDGSTIRVRRSARILGMMSHGTYSG